MPRLPSNHRPVLLDAAERLLLRYGYGRMTVDDVAREAGIGKGTVYLHFDSKEEMALAVTNRWSDRVFDRLRALAAEPRPPAGRLRAMLEARVLGRFEQVGAATDVGEMFTAIRPALVVQREQLLLAETRIFIPVLRELASGRGVGDALLLRTARALLTGTNWLLPYYQDASQRVLPADLQRHIRDVAALLVAGARQVLRPRRAV